MIIAEERRALEKRTHIKICTAAIDSVENSLAQISKDEHSKFVCAIKMYLRATIAHSIQKGPGKQP